MKDLQKYHEFHHNVCRDVSTDYSFDRVSVLVLSLIVIGLFLAASRSDFTHIIKPLL